jgi:hypothetical protein
VDALSYEPKRKAEEKRKQRRKKGSSAVEEHIIWTRLLWEEVVEVLQMMVRVLHLANQPGEERKAHGQAERCLISCSALRCSLIYNVNSRAVVVAVVVAGARAEDKAGEGKAGVAERAGGVRLVNSLVNSLETKA